MLDFQPIPGVDNIVTGYQLTQRQIDMGLDRYLQSLIRDSEILNELTKWLAEMQLAAGEGAGKALGKMDRCWWAAKQDAFKFALEHIAKKRRDAGGGIKNDVDKHLEGQK